MRHTKESERRGILPVAYLKVVINEQAFSRELEGDLIVGRSPDCGICIESRYISRIQCRFFVADDYWYVSDGGKRGSGNGTMVYGANGVSAIAANHKLADGDRIKFGSVADVCLTFRQGDLTLSEGPTLNDENQQLDQVAVCEENIKVLAAKLAQLQDLLASRYRKEERRNRLALVGHLIDLGLLAVIVPTMLAVLPELSRHNVDRAAASGLSVVRWVAANSESILAITAAIGVALKVSIVKKQEKTIAQTQGFVRSFQALERAELVRKISDLSTTPQ